MKDLQRLKTDLHALFKRQYFAVLATRSEKQIHTTLVAFAATDDLKTVFVCTPRTTRKYANLKENPEISLLVHNSTNQAVDIRKAIAVTVSGTAVEVPAGRLTDARSIYLAKQPHMAGFVNAPNTAIVEIDVRRYDVVARFQDVTILEILTDRILS